MSDDYDKTPYPVIPREIAEKYADDPAIRSLLRDGSRLTRPVYLNRVWHGSVPEPWTYEHEAEVPEIFRDPKAVKPV